MELNQEKYYFIRDRLYEAGTKIRAYNEVEISTKSSARDLVTEVDQEIERFLSEEIMNKYPFHLVMGEESYQAGQIDVNHPNLWVIDPIDGTTNFVKQRENFAIMVAYFEKGLPIFSFIYDVMQDQLYSAFRGDGVRSNGKLMFPPEPLTLGQALIAIDIQRMWGSPILDQVIEESFDIRYIGCSALDGINVLKGNFGAYINFKGGPWDFAPFILMAEEMGLILTDFSNQPLRLNDYSSFVLASPAIHRSLFK